MLIENVYSHVISNTKTHTNTYTHKHTIIHEGTVDK